MRMQRKSLSVKYRKSEAAMGRDGDATWATQCLQCLASPGHASHSSCQNVCNGKRMMVLHAMQPGKADTAVAPSKKKTERIIVFVLGGPGSGKGTQVKTQLHPKRYQRLLAAVVAINPCDF